MSPVGWSPSLLPSSLCRSAQEEDLDRIEALERAAFTSPWSRASFQSLLGREDVDFCVLESPPGEVVGYGIAWRIGPEGELGNLAIAEEARRQGCGGVLLDALLARAREQGVQDLFLEVRESNEGAQALYRSRGFLPIGRRPDYYTSPREDAFVMHLSLPSAEEGTT